MAFYACTMSLSHSLISSEAASTQLEAYADIGKHVWNCIQVEVYR